MVNFKLTDKTYGYVNSDYLTAAGKLFAPIKRRSYELLGNISGCHILDLGCGPGLDTNKLANMVGETGQVDGVDFDIEMIKLAEQRSNKAGICQRVKHYHADAYELPFTNNLFNAVRSERLFMHLSQPSRALAEIVRVTASEGRIVLIDTDWGSLSTATNQTESERCLARFSAEEFFSNGYSGRDLYGLMNAHGIKNITLETFSLHLTDLPLWRFITQMERIECTAQERGVISKESLASWRNDLHSQWQRGAFFSSITVVIAAGTILS